MTPPVPAVDDRRPALHRWAWLIVLIGGVAAYLIILRTLVITQNPLYVPSMLLLGSAVVPASVLVYAASGRDRGPVGAATIAAVAGTGGVFGTVAAGTLEYDTLQRLGAVPMIMVGLIEESAKLVVPIVILVFAHRLRAIPAAGVVIGIASGMGFATLETMGYGFSALLETRSIADLDQTLLLRGLLSPAGHVAWTGITTAALWRIPTARRRGWAVLVSVGAFVASVALHALWDGSDSAVVRAVVGLVSFGALLVVVHRSRRPAGPDPSADAVSASAPAQLRAPVPPAPQGSQPSSTP
ncbi:MAG TPA: PrsW family intramembrane metalloprotease [Microlunatus sp.]|nr:PrsW family intramembrane metalloprotease [Microlunatus sp.]